MPTAHSPRSSPRPSWQSHWHHVVLLAGTLVLLSLLCANPVSAQDGPPDVSDAVLARGQALFQGSANCQECHGPAGAGTDLGPDLTDAVWLHGEGSYQMVVRLVTHGVTQRESTGGTAMPMRGWSPLTDDQLTAVATYVWSLSHGDRLHAD